MRDGGRLSAAIEILDSIERYKRPPRAILQEWGQTHRYAGSGDRAWISGLVMDALRHKARGEWAFGKGHARASVLWVYVRVWGISLELLCSVLEKDPYAPDLLSYEEKKGLLREIETAPEWVYANLPQEWYDTLKPGWGKDTVPLGISLSDRAETCFRVNTLKADLKRVEKALHLYDMDKGKWSEDCLKIKKLPSWKRSPSFQHHRAWIKGWIEVQDEGSQLAALSVNAQVGEQILDYCTGAGGKALALSSSMRGKGQIYAYDKNKSRMKDLYGRIKKSGVRNLQVIDTEQTSCLSSLREKMDKVLIDVPCSGSGVWRRKPESKWRLNQETFKKRRKEQADILYNAADYVRSGGQLIYITCSLFYEENQGQVKEFLKRRKDYQQIDSMRNLEKSGGVIPEQLLSLKTLCVSENTITLSPLRTGTDGFFIAVLERKTHP